MSRFIKFILMQSILLINKYFDIKLWTQNLRHLLGGLKVDPMTEPSLQLRLFVKCFKSESTDSAKYLQNWSQKSDLSVRADLSHFMKSVPGHPISLLFPCYSVHKSGKQFRYSFTFDAPPYGMLFLVRLVLVQPWHF